MREVNSMDTSLYHEVMQNTMRGYNLRCIDGSIHGCSKCVGYCSYDGHTGFLTTKMQEEHDCIGKKCFYHFSKPEVPKRRREDNRSLPRKILSIAQAETATMEGLRVIRVSMGPNARCIVHYAAIAEYDMTPVQEAIAESSEYPVCMKQIPCDFDTAVTLIMS